MKQRGYAEVGPGELASPREIAGLAAGVEALEAAGWPATFILVFDETWDLLERMRKSVIGSPSPAGGSSGCINVPNLDVLAWKVDPAKGQAGFSPHRDRQPVDVPGSFHPNGTARYFTGWLALSDATVHNSCLYCLPRAADPGYDSGDLDDVDPLARALGSKESYQNIRALPCSAGASVVFTHRLIHWGSGGNGAGGAHSVQSGSPGAGPAPPPPRLALAAAFSDPDFEPPYFSVDMLPQPPLHMRVALAAAQMIAYYQRFEVSASQLRLFRELYERHQSEFHPTYRQKVLSELVGASTEATARAAREGDDEDSEDVLDEALERVLDAEADESGGFDDDFDLAQTSSEEEDQGQDEDEAGPAKKRRI